MFDTASLLAFDAQAQDALEAQFPAEIRSTSGAALPCAGGKLRSTAFRLEQGGSLEEYAVIFRVRKTLLPGGPPEVGGRLQWRRTGELEWRDAGAIRRVVDSAASVAYLLGAGHVDP